MWNGVNDFNKYHLISQRQICRPKKTGELGILNFKTFNILLMANIALETVLGTQKLGAHITNPS